MFLEGPRRNGVLLFMPALLCLVLFVFRAIYTHTSTYWFLIENLALAFLPLLISWALVWNLKRQAWLAWENLALSVLWLIFLPNAWYVITDYVHTAPTGQISQLFDVVLVTSLVVAGYTYGFKSLWMVHKELLKRLSFRLSATAIGVILLLSSFAIYLGRDLRWSSWDILANPAGITLDVSDRLVHPLGHTRSWDMTGAMFLLLSTIYVCLWLLLEPGKKLNG